MPRILSRLLETLKSTRSFATAASSETAQKAAVDAAASASAQRIPLATRRHQRLRDEIERGEAHFRVGGKKLFLPTARVVLLRPNAKHTPYQAKFIVPVSFNKFDLRDYLWHVYGLRAFKITTQLQHRAYTRSGSARARYRGPQIKKMTIEMLEPFVWPQEPNDKSAWNVQLENELEKYQKERFERLGSDKAKPSEAFEGAIGPYTKKATPFIPKMLKKKMLNKKVKAAELKSKQPKEERIKQFLKL